MSGLPLLFVLSGKIFHLEQFLHTVAISGRLHVSKAEGGLKPHI